MTPEGKVKKKVKDLLAKFPHVYVRWPVPSGFGKDELDAYGCIDGLYFAIETKREGEKLTDRQTKTANEVLAAGGAVFVIVGGDQYGFTQLQRFLEANSRATISVPGND